MSLPTRDDIISASPLSITSDLGRPHLPLSRSFDPNDPEARERQRTMDVDMAMHLSRARRETVLVAPGTSPYESVAHVQTQDHPVILPLSYDERHHLDIAKGEETHGGDDEFSADDVTLHPHLRASSLDLRNNLQQAHDPSLLASLGLPHSDADTEDQSSSMFGLPRYQADASRSSFNFALMEQYAVEEKARLGISTPAPRFSGSASGPPDVGITADPAQPLSRTEGNFNLSSTTPLRSAPSRKLSQSITSPRVHRKGVGGKVALFEGSLGAPSPHLSRLGGHNLMSHSSGDVLTSGSVPVTVSGGGVIPGIGILNMGHDRPYRFSFYSNTLSATIHSRSLSELPGEGQSFLDLFTGISSPHYARSGAKPSTANKPPTAYHPQIPNAADTWNRQGLVEVETGSGDAFVQRRGSKNIVNFDPSAKSVSRDPHRNGLNGGMIGSGEDLEGSTWWLDVLSPTDEEMKMLSDVRSSRNLPRQLQ
jgi:magnesium transporter